MIQNLVKKVFGSRSDREVKQLYPLVNEINKFADKLLDKSDEELKARSIELRTEIINRRNQIETIPEDSELDDLIEENNDLLPEHFHPELNQQNDNEDDNEDIDLDFNDVLDEQNNNNLNQVIETEDSDLDINNRYDSEEFFREIDDEMTGIVNEHLFTTHPPHILTDEDVDMIVPSITPPVTPILNPSDIIIDIMDMNRVD